MLLSNHRKAHWPCRNSDCPWIPQRTMVSPLKHTNAEADWDTQFMVVHGQSRCVLRVSFATGSSDTDQNASSLQSLNVHRQIRTLETLLKSVSQRCKAQIGKALRKPRILQILDKSFPKFQAQQSAWQGHVLPTGRVKVFTKVDLFQSLREYHVAQILVEFFPERQNPQARWKYH